MSDKRLVLVDVLTMHNPVATAELSDGSSLRIGVVLRKVSRIEGQYDQQGNPVYHLDWHIDASVSDSPEELKASKH